MWTLVYGDWEKRKQCPCKPGSVSALRRCLPFIYSVNLSTAQAFHPPSFTLRNRADNPRTMVYMNLQPPDGTACQSPDSRWSLTPPSHPYPCLSGAGGCFLLPCPAVADSFYFQKWGVLCCPDFPLAPSWRKRQAGTLLPQLQR